MSGLAKFSARAIDGSDVDLASYSGEVLGRCAPTTKPGKIAGDIEEALAA
jgi:glutathione peroxidase-family protein